MMLDFAKLNERKYEIWKDGTYIGSFFCGKDGMFLVSTVGVRGEILMADDFRQIADKLDELNSRGE